MQLFDEHELAFEESLHLVWNAFEIALTSAGPSQLCEVLAGRGAGRTQFLGIFIAQLIQRKRAAVGDFDGIAKSFGMAGEKLCHLGR